MSRDLLVVGSGIVGLACAWAGLRHGLSVQVLDRDPVCVGASIRNFGFVTVTGQGRGLSWERAMRSREVWTDLAPQAGISVEHQGLYVLARRPEAQAVLLALLEQPEGRQLKWLDPAALRREAPVLAHPDLQGALYSPYELRIEPQLAMEKLRHWLAGQGVEFHMGQAAQQVFSGGALTAQGCLQAERVVVCPGPDLRSLFPEVFQRRGVRLCQLQMLRVRPPQGYRLPAGVMADLSLARYRGYSELSACAALTARLQVEQPHELDEGIHLIIVQSADGTLVVGDSHRYGSALAPFAEAQVERLILEEMQRLVRLPQYEVIARWTGVYPSAGEDAFIENVLPGVDVVSVTSGTGMSTSFGLAEEWLQSWKGRT